MGKAYKCDRCGSFFERSELRIDFVGKLQLIKIGLYSDKTFDLCDKCTNELKDWMKMEKETKDDNTK